MCDRQEKRGHVRGSMVVLRISVVDMQTSTSEPGTEAESKQENSVTTDVSPGIVVMLSVSVVTSSVNVSRSVSVSVGRVTQLVLIAPMNDAEGERQEVWDDRSERRQLNTASEAR